MKRPESSGGGPPIVLDYVLRLILTKRNRETVSGDLFEVFCEERLPQLGRTRACFWYARQLTSLGYHRLIGGILMKRAWIVASVFLMVAGSCFAVMENILRHPGYPMRMAISGLIVLQGALSVLYGRHGRGIALRPSIIVGACGAIVLGLWAVASEFRTTDFEGYILLIGLGLVFQGLLTLVLMMGRRRLQSA